MDLKKKEMEVLLSTVECEEVRRRVVEVGREEGLGAAAGEGVASWSREQGEEALVDLGRKEGTYWGVLATFRVEETVRVTVSHRRFIQRVYSR